VDQVEVMDQVEDLEALLEAVLIIEKPPQVVEKRSTLENRFYSSIYVFCYCDVIPLFICNTYCANNSKKKKQIYKL